MNPTLKKILVLLAIAFVMLLTLNFIKVLPALLKILALAANIVTIYWAYTIFKEKKDKQ